ncbi:hypothetical protein ACWD25_23825 [Streptomyces sp. NPDC002920]
MTAPPDETSSGRADGPGPEPERGHVDDVILSMAAAGVTVRRIAQEVGLAKSTVHDRLSLLLRTRTQRASDEFIAMWEVRLEDLYRRAYGSLTRMEKDSDAWDRAWDRCLRAEESLRQLMGADAPEAMTIALERRAESEAEMTATAILAAVDAVSLPDDRRAYALEAASARLHAIEGDFTAPEPLPPLGAAPTPYRADGGQLYIDGPEGLRYRVTAVEPKPAPTVDRPALPPGPSAGRERDGAEAVLAEVAKFEAEFGPLGEDEEDDDPAAPT